MIMPRRLNRPLAALCFLAFLAQQGQAAATWSVLNDSASGNGSLLKAVTDSNNAGGTNTIAWGTGSGGTIALSSGLPSINNDTTLDVTGAPSAVTISSSSISLGGAVTFNNGSPQIWSITSFIIGGGSLTKTGTGELDLRGANSYSGGTTLNAGTLGVESDFALGSGTLTYNGGVLQLGSGINAANDIQLNAGAAFDTAGNNATLSGVISEGVAGSSVTKVGAGTLLMTGTNSYSGGTFINTGTLSISLDSALGNAASSITFNGGTLQMASGLNDSRAVTLDSGGGTIDTGVNSSTFTGVFSGAGSLTKVGTGALFLTGTNSYNGGTLIDAGTLGINADAALGNAASSITFNGGTLQIAAGLNDSRAVTLNSGGTIDTGVDSSTFTGVFSGNGSMTKAGAGMLTLFAANTYTGGTTVNAGTLSISTDSNLGNAAGPLTFNGGTLQTTAGITSGRNISLAGSGTIDTQIYDSTFTGVISGGGALTQLGNGVLFLAGANSYSGGTVFNNGTINVSSASALGSGQLTFNGAGTLQTLVGITVTSNVTLNTGAIGVFDMMGNTSTISGVIGGAGSLALVSSGTLTLTGANTYTGGTLVNNLGVLSINNGSAVGTSTLTLDNGTLRTTAALTLANNVALGANGGTLDSYGQASTFSSAIAGSTLTIADTLGGGMIILSGHNTYTGGTIVNGGTLRLGASNALPSSGDLRINSGATFDMADFTPTVGGNYIGAGTISMLQPNNLPNSLTVTNNANFNGGTLVINLMPQIVNEHQPFSPILYGSNAGNTQFTTIISPAALSFTYYAPAYNPHDLTLTVHLVPFANSANNPNQTTIGNSLEPLRDHPTGDNATVIGNLYALDAPHLQSALDQIGPISLAAMSSLGMAGSGVQTAAVGQRMAALADGTAPDGVTNYTVSGRMNTPGGPLLAYAGDDLGSLDLGAAHERPTSNSPWGFYASGVGSTGRLSEATTDSGLQPGYAFNTAGLAGGGDYRLNKNLAVGGSAGYIHGHASIYAPASGTVDNNSARYGVYAAGYNETARASLYIGGASDFFATRRGIQFGEISRVATASPQGNEFNLDASASFDVKTREWGTLSPFAGLDYNRLMIDSFAESGAGALNLDVAPQTAQSLQSSLGLRYSDKIQMDSCMLLPHISLGWRHEFVDQSHPIEAQLASGAGSVFSVATGDFARDGTLFGTGFSLDWGKGLTAKFDYAGDFRSHFQDSNYNATLHYKF